jgi:hypothetical protein
MTNVITKSTIAKEAASQVIAVFQHYADQDLTKEQRDKIRKTVEDLIPEDFTYESWKEYADLKDKEMKEQS